MKQILLEIIFRHIKNKLQGWAAGKQFYREVPESLSGDQDEHETANAALWLEGLTASRAAVGRPSQGGQAEPSFLLLSPGETISGVLFFVLGLWAWGRTGYYAGKSLVEGH